MIFVNGMFNMTFEVAFIRCMTCIIYTILKTLPNVVFFFRRCLDQGDAALCLSYRSGCGLGLPMVVGQCGRV